MSDSEEEVEALQERKKALKDRKKRVQAEIDQWMEDFRVENDREPSNIDK